MWNKRTRSRGLTLYEALITTLILLLVLSSVASLLQSSLRVLKSQQGRELSEAAFLQEMLRRELADASGLTAGVGELSLTRPDPGESWDELRVSPELPDTFSSVAISYRLVEGKLQRRQGSVGPVETLLALNRFDSVRQVYDLRLDLELQTGSRVRRLIWNFGSPAL